MRALASRRQVRRAGRLAVPAAAVAFLAIAVVGMPGRLTGECVEWLGIAVALEVLSVIGFIVVFKLVFGRRMTWRQAVGAGLRAVGIVSVMPAGTLVGPALGARSSSSHDGGEPLTQSTIAFALIASLPGVVVLGLAALGLWAGVLDGPHDAALTLPAVAVAVSAIAAAALVPPARVRARGTPGRVRARGAPGWLRAAVAAARDGVRDARRLLATRDWKLSGAVGYYAFDNAVLWAAFHAEGRTPPLGVIVMGYLVGSLGSLVPLPAGIGAAEGGLIGALVLYGVPLLPATGAVLLYRGISLLVPVGLSACAWTAGPLVRARSAVSRSRRHPRAPARDPLSLTD